MLIHQNQNSKSYIDSIKHGKHKENQQKIAQAHLTKQYKSRLGLTKVPKYIGYICCKFYVYLCQLLLLFLLSVLYKRKYNGSNVVHNSSNKFFFDI